MLSWRSVFSNSFTFVSDWSIHIELLGLILRIDGIVLSAKYTKHSFPFLKHKPVYSRLVTRSQTLVENPLVLKLVLWWLHSFLFCFAQALTVLTLVSIETFLPWNHSTGRWSVLLALKEDSKKDLTSLTGTGLTFALESLNRALSRDISLIDLCASFTSLKVSFSSWSSAGTVSS